MNTLRTAMLLAAMTALFMGVGFLIGGSGGMMIALLIAAATNLFSYWNADKMVLTSDKSSKKMIYRHSGYPGGIRERSYGDLMEKKPQEAVRRSIRGMLPKTRLGRAQISKLKVYAGPTHPHAAQQPQPLALEQARARS